MSQIARALSSIYSQPKPVGPWIPLQEMQPPPWLLTLPQDMLLEMIQSGGLKKEDVVALKRTSQHFYLLIDNSEAIWTELYTRHFGSPLKPPGLGFQEAMDRRISNVRKGVFTSRALTEKCRERFVAVGEGKVTFFSNRLYLHDVFSGIKRVLEPSFPLGESSHPIIRSGKLYAITSHGPGPHRCYGKMWIQIWDLNSARVLYNDSLDFTHKKIDKIDVVDEMICFICFDHKAVAVLHLNEENHYVGRTSFQLSRFLHSFKAAIFTKDQIIISCGCSILRFGLESGNLLADPIVMDDDVVPDGLAIFGNQCVAMLRHYKDAEKKEHYPRIVFFNLDSWEKLQDVVLWKSKGGDAFIVGDDYLFIHDRFDIWIDIYQIKTMERCSEIEYSLPRLDKLSFTYGKLYCLIKPYQGVYFSKDDAPVLECDFMAAQR